MTTTEVVPMVAAMATAAAGRSAFGARTEATGYFAPAEEAPHARTWMCWPSTPSIYGASTGYFESVQETLGRLAAAIAEHEPVTLLAAQQQVGIGAQLDWTE